MFCTDLGALLKEFPGWALRSLSRAPTVTFLRHRAALGDTLELTALIRGLRKAVPEARIAVATRRPDVFLNNPHVDENRGWHLCRTGLTVRAGYGGEDLTRLEHVVDVQWRALWRELAAAGFPVPPGGPPAHDGVHPEIFLTEEELERARAELRALSADSGAKRVAGATAGRPVVLISAGGKTKPVHNREWGWANFQAVAAALASYATLVQVGGDRRLSVLEHPLPDLRGRPIRETAALFAEADALLTQEGGLAHLARAAKASAVVVFGGSLLPQQTGYREMANLHSRPACSPCFGSSVNCPHLKCMVAITPRLIVASLAELLRRTKGMVLPPQAAAAAPDEWTPPEFVDRARLTEELARAGPPEAVCEVP